jgi:hypothetical protein
MVYIQPVMTDFQSVIIFFQSSPKLSTFLMQVLAMLLTCLFIPRLKVTSIFGAVFMVLSISFINRTLWDDHMFNMIPLDKTQSTIYLFLANGVIFWLLVKILPGIEVSGILPALVAPVVFSITNLAVTEASKNIDWKKVSVIAVDKVHIIRDELKEHTDAIKKQ